MILEMYKEYSNLNEEKFNEDFIKLKYNEDVLEVINDVFLALEVIDGLKFISSEIITDENLFPHIIKNDEKVMNIEVSRLNMIRFKFELNDPEGKEESKIVEKHLFYPKVMPGYNFLLNDSRHYPIYQIVDSATFKTFNSLNLKTLLMPIKLRTEDVSYNDYNGVEYNGNIKILDLFKKKINYLLYFLAEFGMTETLKFHQAENDVSIINIEDMVDDDKDHIYFSINKSTLLKVSVDLKEKNENFFYNLIDIILCENRQPAKIFDHDYWVLELGRKFSRNVNNRREKALSILVSFKRILDNRTKKTLPLKPENKESIYHIIRWMANNYERLSARDNMDLDNKRLRVTEYLLYDLLLRFSNITYRLLNRNKIKIKGMEELFNSLSPMFIIKSIGSNELLRYMGGVNAIELFNSTLKFSYRGSQGLGSGKSSVKVEYRGLNPSYVGRIALTPASQNDPGMTGTLVPFLETNGMYFNDKLLD